MRISKRVNQMENLINQVPDMKTDAHKIHDAAERLFSDMNAIEKEVLGLKDFSELNNSLSKLQELTDKMSNYVNEGLFSPEDKQNLSGKIEELNRIILKSPMEELPDELYMKIFDHLDRKDLANVTSISKRSALISQDTAFLRHKGEYGKRIEKAFKETPADKWNAEDFKKAYQKELENVETLDLHNYDVSPELLKFLEQNCPRIQHLILHQNVNDELLTFLPKNLVSLILAECDQISDEGLGHISKLKKLAFLDLRLCTQITDKGIENLLPLKNLIHLTLSQCKNFTEAGFGRLAAFKNLATLELQECNQIQSGWLKHLSPFIHLTSLNLNGCKEVGDAGLEHISSLKSLAHLKLNYCTNFTEAGFGRLAALKDLLSLELRGCKQIQNNWLKHLTALVHLTSLSLGRCSQLTGDGLQHLVSLESLVELNLQGCRKIKSDDIKNLSERIKVVDKISRFD